MAVPASPKRAAHTRSPSHPKTIRVEDVDALVRGCAVLGAGGGGDAFMFRIMAELALAETGPVPLKSLDELPEDGIVLPLAMPGVIAGFLFVFVVALGSSTEIQLLGGAGDSNIAIMINDVMRVVNFPLAFAIATAVVFFMSAIVLLADRMLQLSRMFEELDS